MTRYIGAAVVAKHVRRDLAERFPGCKFGVRTRKYSGGAAIGVSWTDGPTDKEVEKAVGWYAGAGFDGMIDLKYCKHHYLLPNGKIIYGGTEGTEGSRGVRPRIEVECPKDAEPVQLGAHYIQLHRDFSLEFYTRLAQEVAQEHGLEAPQIIETTYGSPYLMNNYVVGHGWSYSQLIWQKSNETSG